MDECSFEVVCGCSCQDCCVMRRSRLSELTNVPQRHWEWLEDRWDEWVLGFLRSGDGVCGQPEREDGVRCCQALCCTLTRCGSFLFAEMKDVRSSACFENCEPEFRCSRCFRQRRDGESSFVGERMAKYVSWKAEKKWKEMGVCL